MTSPDSGAVNFEIPGECDKVCMTAQELVKIYRELELTQSQIDSLQLALDEAVTNAIEHGHKGDRSKTVRIDCSWDADAVHLSVTDHGSGFDCAALPDPTFNKNILKESGRGLYIISAIMNDVHFNEKGNTIYMTLNRKGDC